MHIHLLAMGTRMPEWVQEGFEEYRKRLPGTMRLQLDEVPLPKRGRSTDPETDRNRDAEALRKRLAQYPQARRVALDGNSRMHDTPGLARALEPLRNRGQSLVLVVGGPEGLSSDLLAEMHECWSLSYLTLPHPLVRVVVAEQLYRCWSFLQGHPYHRE